MQAVEVVMRPADAERVQIELEIALCLQAAAIDLHHDRVALGAAQQHRGGATCATPVLQGSHFSDCARIQ